MWSIIISGLATALSLLVVDLVVPGVTITTITAAAIAAVSIGLVNAFIKPILQTIAVPINFLTFGLFSIVVNGLSFWLSSLAVPGFYVHGILGFILGPAVLAFVSTFLGNYLDRYSPALPQNRSEISTDSSSQP